MIRQLRQFYSPEELAEVYDHPYDHTLWEDHRIRVQVTTHIARWLRDHIGAKTAADLSCGDGAILTNLHLRREDCIYGDLVEARHLDVVGPIEETIRRAPCSPGHWPCIDLLILSETLEHVEEPLALLREARSLTRGLILSTPLGEDNDSNPQHYWGWDAEGIRGLLEDAGFTPVIHTLLDPQVPDGYTYQIWGCV